MSTTSLTSLRTFIKSLHGWTLNIEKAQSSINGMNVSMHNYLEYTIILNVPKISHISFHWFDLSGCTHYLNRISEAIWPLNLFLNLVNQNMFASTGRKFWLLTYSVLGMFVYVLTPHVKILEHNFWVLDTLLNSTFAFI